MDIIFVLAVVIFIEKSCSQTLSQSSSCYADGGTLNLNCNTADLADTITFLLNGNAKGGCFSGTCAPNIVQSGTITTITLSPFSSSTHSGNWTCSYGLSVSPEVVVAENPCSSGGGSTGLTWWEIFLIVLAVLAVVFIITIVLCCILNTRCKFGDVCQDSPLSFTFPPDNESKVKITPASNLDYKEGTPNKESKVKITPASNLDYKEGTPNKGSNENATPKSKPVDKKVTPNQEAIINYNLNNEKSSVATIPQRTGAFQQLNPLNKGEGRNGNGEDLPK